MEKKPTLFMNIPASGTQELSAFPASSDGWVMAFAQAGGAIASVAVGGTIIPNTRPGWVCLPDNDRTVINGGLTDATVTFWL